MVRGQPGEENQRDPVRAMLLADPVMDAPAGRWDRFFLAWPSPFVKHLLCACPPLYSGQGQKHSRFSASVRQGAVLYRWIWQGSTLPGGSPSPRRPHPQTACLCAFCTMGGRCGLCKTAVCAKNAGRGLTGRGPGRILWTWQRRRGVFSPAFSFARKSVPVRIPNHSQRGESCFASRARPFSAAVQTPQAPARRRKTKHRGRNSAYDDVISIIDTLWVLLAAILVFFMNLGFASVEAGFARAKNCVNILSKNFIVFAVSSLALCCWAGG